MIARRFIAVLPALLVSESALAHSPIQGIGNFYNGLLHPVLVPAHLLLITALGLLLGQQGAKKVMPALVAFSVATLAGLIAAWFSVGSGMEAMVLSSSVIIGLLVAISRSQSLWVTACLALLAGLFLGMDSTQDALTGKERMVTLFGNGVAIYLLVLYPMALADYCKKAWQKTGIRVLGSWIAASSLLVLALSFTSQVRP